MQQKQQILEERTKVTTIKGEKTVKFHQFFGKHEDMKNETKEIFIPCLTHDSGSRCFCELIVPQRSLTWHIADFLIRKVTRQ